jgi:cytochrome c biogenesis protein CcmG/thiol:disulfide interchange protein DsbE
MNKNYKIFFPFITLFALFALLAWELFFSNANELPSALIGEDVPAFHLSNLFPLQPAFNNKALYGRTVLVNVWATWCYACENEHEMLMKIKNVYHVPIYGIVYKDNAQDAIRWLAEKGNPYELIGDDKNGVVAIDFGVYGTPETFVINPQGKIIYRHVGVINQKIWDEVLYPLIKKNRD